MRATPATDGHTLLGPAAHEGHGRRAASASPPAGARARSYYRSYIRAFNDAKDASPAVGEKDDDYVTKSEFRYLIVYLGICQR